MAICSSIAGSLRAQLSALQKSLERKVKYNGRNMRVLLFVLLTVVVVTAQDDNGTAIDIDRALSGPILRFKRQDGNGTGIDIDEALSGPLFRFKRQDAYEKICTPGVTTREESVYCACSDDGSGWDCAAMASQIKIISSLIFGSTLVSLFSASFYR